MKSKAQKQKQYNQGKRDARRGKQSKPPGTGFGKIAGIVVGAATLGPIGALFGGLLGDGTQDRRNRQAYKKGYRNNKHR